VSVGGVVGMGVRIRVLNYSSNVIKLAQCESHLTIFARCAHAYKVCWWFYCATWRIRVGYVTEMLMFEGHS
jgi:hypothetical protein